VKRAALAHAFEERFGRAPEVVVRAPGRVNLIGEHTDYNGGFVMPVAIDRWVWIALGRRTDRRVVAESLDFEETADFELDALSRGKGWAEYLKGTAWALQEEGIALEGWNGIVAGEVPIGAGLSSSAALEMATARAFAAVGAVGWDPSRMARAAQRAENEWVGVRCGIMDQMASAAGRAGHALLIDCRSLETVAVPLPVDTAVLVLDTSTRRGLVDSHYNERREECERAARLLGAASLRDVAPEEVEKLPGLTLRRARHVVTENARTLRAAKALGCGDVQEAGRLMDESHESLARDFEVVTSALETMVRCARRAPGCVGARMTGAGFGGCVVALVRGPAVEDFVTAVSAAYRAESGLQPKIHTCRAADGAEIVRNGAAG
jgi:galactokinase